MASFYLKGKIKNINTMKNEQKMAIRNNYKEYKNIFDKYNLNIDGLDKFFKKVKLFEIISKTTLLNFRT